LIKGEKGKKGECGEPKESKEEPLRGKGSWPCFCLFMFVSLDVWNFEKHMHVLWKSYAVYACVMEGLCDFSYAKRNHDW